MNAKITVHHESLEVDLSTRRGGSAVRVAWDTYTEVYYGTLHAAVTLHELHLCVILDPEPGDWKDLEWARGTALAAISAPEVLPKVLRAMGELHRFVGMKIGREALQLELRSLLGVTR